MTDSEVKLNELIELTENFLRELEKYQTDLSNELPSGTFHLVKSNLDIIKSDVKRHLEVLNSFKTVREDMHVDDPRPKTLKDVWNLVD